MYFSTGSNVVFLFINGVLCWTWLGGLVEGFLHFLYEGFFSGWDGYES